MKIHTAFSLMFFVPVSLFAQLAGTYKVSGVDPTTGSYTGTASLVDKGKSVYTMHWDMSDGTSDDGTGVQRG